MSRFGPAWFVSLLTQQEALVAHVIFPELDTLGMPLQDLLHQLLNAAFVLKRPCRVPLDPRIVRGESPLDLVVQDRKTVRAHFGIILDVLDEPP
jgi:hypothetical protein